MLESGHTAAASAALRFLLIGQRTFSGSSYTSHAAFRCRRIPLDVSFYCDEDEIPFAVVTDDNIGGDQHFQMETRDLFLNENPECKEPPVTIQHQVLAVAYRLDKHGSVDVSTRLDALDELTQWRVSVSLEFTILTESPRIGFHIDVAVSDLPWFGLDPTRNRNLFLRFIRLLIGRLNSGTGIHSH